MHCDAFREHDLRQDAMRQIGLVLEYVGTAFQGFQVQAQRQAWAQAGGEMPGAAQGEGTGAATGSELQLRGKEALTRTGRAIRTVQGAVEDAIARISGEQRRIVGAGRTDAGVHALGQVASFATGSRIPGDRFAPALNTALPPDVRALRSFDAPESFNARYDAIAKVYRYVIVPEAQAGSALLSGRALLVKKSLDMQAMSDAARCLVGQHDFSAFASTGSSARTSVRTIRRLEVQPARNGFLGLDAVTVEIEADGFLYKMVRAIVGALLEVGAGRADAGLLGRLLESRDRSKGPATAPPDGLYLVRVIYPEPLASLVSGFSVR